MTQSVGSARVLQIARLNRQRQTQDDRFCRIEFIRVSLQPRQRTRARFQFLAVERLPEEVVGAGLDSGDAIGAIGKSRNQDRGTRRVDGFSFTRRQNSMPSRCGMSMSDTIRSGCSASTIRQAIAPSAADVTV